MAEILWICHKTPNEESINQPKQASADIKSNFPWWMDHCSFLSVRDVIIANEGWPTVFTVILVMACNINTDPGISELWSVVPARYDFRGSFAFVD